MLRKLLMLCVLGLTVSTQHAQAIEAAGKHKEDVGPYGRVYLFVPLMVPMCPSELFFMQEVANINGLETFAQNVTPSKEQYDMFWAKDFKGFFPKDFKPKLPTEVEMQRMAEAAKSFKRQPYQAPFDAAEKYGVSDFPAFIYLAPDLNLYKFKLDPCQSDRDVNQFKSVLKEFQDGKRRGKKAWSFGDKN